jgi:Zn-dependent membrane protease YugP
MASIGSNKLLYIIRRIYIESDRLSMWYRPFSAVVVFQLITLPVEFDASARAKKLLWDTGVLASNSEREGVAAVLNAAALTYVAAAVSAIVTLIYYLIRAGLLGGKSDD